MGGGEFPRSQRFRQVRQLGMGGMGVVYEAIDHQDGARVALKTLRAWSADGLTRFKREFRALQDLQHPNLVSLNELFQEDGVWFFSMELVRGLPFIAYVRPGGGDDDVSATEVTAPAAGVTGRAPVDEARLRGALAQLASGLHYLHRAGKVHRDVKPSNVLVGHDGRVVLVDFGLVADDHATGDSTAGSPVGTADYMAPEQATGEVGPASDWYSVGVMIYEALAGRPPFVGRPLEVLMEKQRREAPPLPDGLPADLAALCAELLRFDARARPDGDEVLRRLAVADAAAAAPVSGTWGPLFIGRERELGELAGALAEVRAGSAAVVCVHGVSGVGKSAVVREFTDRMDDGDTLVLAGRCYERESVPYKAFDGVIDALGRHLRSLAAAEVAALLPRQAALLVQVFPVLGRIEPFAQAPRPRRDILDGFELRTRAFAALRELLGRLAERRTLVLTIDDAQWADADSAALLGILLGPPDPPPVLVIATARDADTPFLAGVGRVRRVAVRPLGLPEARELALSLLARTGMAADADLAARIARESEGHPLFLDALIRHVAAGGDPTELHLETALSARVAQLDADARRVLEVTSLAAGPVDAEVLANAAELQPGALSRIASQLRVANLARGGGPSGAPVEVFHDRVRVAVVALLDEPERAARHRRLALAIQGRGNPDPELLAVHWREAGELDIAAGYAVDAAERAVAALAFDRAAHFYQQALERIGGEEGRRLRTALGDALVNAGRGADAAQAYLAAAAGGNAAETLDLRRRAAEQLLLSGHIDQGLAVIDEVLGVFDMKLPRTPRRALLTLLGERARLRLRGLGFRPRDESQVAADVLTRVDVCWSVSVGLGLVDTIRGNAYAARGLRLALRAGERYRVARALAVEAALLATGGRREVAQADRLFEIAGKIAAEVDNPHAIGLLSFSRGLARYLRGRFAEGHELCAQAEQVLRERCTGVAWEVDNSQLYGLMCLNYLGQMRALAERMQVAMREAEGRGDLYAITNFSTRILPSLLLAAGEPAEARRQLAEAMRRWPHGAYVQHYFELIAQVSVDLYTGDAEQARRRVADSWGPLERAFLLRVRFIRLNMLLARARATLAAGPGAGELRAIAADAGAIAAFDMPCAAPFAELLQAGMASVRGDVESAASLLERADAGFSAASMALLAAAARRARARLAGDRAGLAAADAAIRGLGVTDPERFEATQAPGV